MDHHDEVYNSSTEWEERIGTAISRTNSRSPSPLQLDPLPPRIVLLGLWPGARREQIDYYVDCYKELYPSAKILLLRHSRTSTRYIEEILETLTPDYEKLSPHADILIHLFGDAAAVNICKLLRAYRARTNSPLNVGSIILDSVPANLLLFIWLTLLALFCGQDQRDLYDSELLPEEARKCYVFAGRGVMWAWGSGVGEEGVWERREWEVRRGAVGRCGRWRWSGDQERFWLGVEDAWEGGRVWG